MDVACPACAAKYTADEEKLRGKKARMRCKACNTAWIVTGPGADEGAAAISMPPPASIPPPASAKPASMKPPGSIAPPSMKPPSVAPAPGSIAPPRADKTAAVVKTGNEREKRDLFAEKPADEGKVKDTLLPPPSYGFSGTGARSENSVLFRVDQLANMAGRIHTPEPERVAPVISQKSGGDEEGVIDLKALASVPPPGKRSIIPVAPLFSEPPPMTLDAAAHGSRPSIAKPVGKAKLAAALLGAVAFLGLAGVGLSFAFKGEEAVKRPAAITPAPPAPPPSASVAAAPSADPAPATSVASNDDPDPPKKGKKKRKAKSAGGGGGTAAAAPKPPKPADPCGCHGDFNCILACTAKNGH